MDFVSVIVVESLLLSLSLAVSAFLIHIATGHPMADLPLGHVIFGTGVLYFIRVLILASKPDLVKTLILRNVVDDPKIQIVVGEKKWGFWHWIFLILGILSLIFFLWQCVRSGGLTEGGPSIPLS